MLFLGSHTFSTNHSLPVNLMEMTNGGGGFGLAPSRGAERGLLSPFCRAILIGGQWCAMLRSTGAMCWSHGWSRGVGFGGHQVSRSPSSAQTAELQARCQRVLDAESRDSAPQGWWSSCGAGCSLGISSMAMGAQCGASSTMRQRGSAGHAVSPSGSGRSSSSSSLRLFEEAISGRAGSSYHSLLTPGRQEGEPASPPHPHRALPQRPVPAELAPCIPGTLVTPQSRAMACPKVGDTPSVRTSMPTAPQTPWGGCASAQHPRGGKQRVEGTGPVHPHISKCVFGGPPS